MKRRAIGLALLGTGMFLLVMAYVLPFTVYPKLAILPTDPQVGQTAFGTGFSVFLPRSVEDGGIQQLENVNVTSKVFVSEDRTTGAKPQDSPNANWRVATSTYVNGVSPKKLLETTVEGVSLDRRTSLANNCCRDYMLTDKGDNEGEHVTHEGYVFMFPFGTKKQTYPVWDGAAGKTFPAVYESTEKKRGFTTYRFEQYVPDMKTGTQAIPGQYVGVKDPSVEATYMYKTHRTYWIEPHSGAIVDYREAMDRRFVYKGRSVPVIQGTLNLIPPDPDDEISKLLSTASKGLPLLRWRLPILFVPLGIVLIAVGIARIRRGNAALDDDWDDDWDDEDEDEVDSWADEEPADDRRGGRLSTSSP